MTELKPCDCGSKNIESVEKHFTTGSTLGFKCKNCGRETLQYYTLEDAINAWNINYIINGIKDSYKKYKGTQ